MSGGANSRSPSSVFPMETDQNHLFVEVPDGQELCLIMRYLLVTELQPEVRAMNFYMPNIGAPCPYKL